MKVDAFRDLGNSEHHTINFIQCIRAASVSFALRILFDILYYSFFKLKN